MTNLQNLDMNVYKQIAERMKAERDEEQNKQTGEQTAPSQDITPNSPENTNPVLAPTSTPVQSPQPGIYSRIEWDKFLPPGYYPADSTVDRGKEIFINTLWAKSKKSRLPITTEDIAAELLRVGASNQLNLNKHIEEIVDKDKKYCGLRGLIFKSDFSTWKKFVNPTTKEVSYILELHNYSDYCGYM